MPAIEFKNIDPNNFEKLRGIFSFIAEGKRAGHIDETKLASMLRQRITEHFTTTNAEADDWLAKWKIDSNIKMPWDFGSWVDAFLNAEIVLESIEIKPDGTGKLMFEQLAWPSGGIEATEEIVKVFGGEVVSNDAI